MPHRAGDKVRLKRADDSDNRGVVEVVGGSVLVVRLERSGRRVRVPTTGATNLSLAARKAWASMPRRAVGRPKGSRRCDRVSVTLRIDRAIWEQFKVLESNGTIDDRTATINRWLGDALASLPIASGASYD